MCLSYPDPETGLKFLYCTADVSEENVATIFRVQVSKPQPVYALYQAPTGVCMSSALSWDLTQRKMTV
jgi:hypothetical protein